MKNLIIDLLLVLVAVLFTVTGCSVKEDRTACPCRLILDFSQVDTAVVNYAHVNIAQNAGTVEDIRMSPLEYFPLCSFSVPRYELYVNIYSGIEDCLLQGEGILIPYGDDCPLVYMHSEVINASSDNIRRTVDMDKNHCVLSINLEKDDDLDYGLCVKGNVNGYGLDGNPRKGDFSYVPDKKSDGGYEAVVPRQTDSSLILEIDDGSNIIKSFALGEYIIAGGYDWDADNLDDISVSIDWALTHVHFTVQGWDWVEEYEIII